MPEIANIARHLTGAARTSPELPALSVPRARRSANEQLRYDTLSFAQLHEQVVATAALLQQRGIERGARTLLLVKPGLNLIRCVFALFWLGAPPVLIDPGMGLRGFLRCVKRTQPTALVGIKKAGVLSRLFFPQFASVRHRVIVDRAGFCKGVEALKLQGELDPKLLPPMAETAPDELAAILFTSGSTGPAKGVQYEHGMFEGQIKLLREAFGFEPGEVDLPILPVFALFNPALGVTTVIPEINPSRPAAADPERIVQAVEQQAVTSSFGSPVLWDIVTRHLEKTGRTLPSVKRVVMAGAPVPPRVLRQVRACLPNAIAFTPYGATECLPITAMRGSDILEETWEKTETGAGTCVGSPIPGVTLGIIRLEETPIARLGDATFLPPNEVGEVIVTGPTVTKQYDQAPEATAKAKIFDEEGRVWHRMGDLGYLDDHGRLWFCGRVAERVETDHGPLYTDPLEGIANTHPDVFRSALIGVGAGPPFTPALAVQPREKPSQPEEFKRSILAFLSDKAPANHVQTVIICENFPVDVRHNAKINRLLLARRFRSP